MKDLISVIMPCYNAEQFLRDSINSVLSQTYGNVELVVIDDGSIDNSQKIIEEFLAEYSDRIVYLKQNHKGPYTARNYGISVSNGEYVSFLDADDYWDKTFLDEMLTSLKSTKADLVYCGWQNVGGSSPGSKPHIPPDYEKTSLPINFLKGCPWPIHGALVKKEILKKVNYFSERYFTSMDYDLWLRMSLAINKIVRVPKVLAFYRWHGEGQISSVKWRQAFNSLKVKKDFIKHNPDIKSLIGKKNIKRILNEPVKRAAYISYWKNDFESSWHLFRKLIKENYWNIKEMRYLIPALLPKFSYIMLLKKIRQ